MEPELKCCNSVQPRRSYWILASASPQLLKQMLARSCSLIRSKPSASPHSLNNSFTNLQWWDPALPPFLQLPSSCFDSVYGRSSCFRIRLKGWAVCRATREQPDLHGNERTMTGPGQPLQSVLPGWEAVVVMNLEHLGCNVLPGSVVTRAAEEGLPTLPG